MDSREFIPRSEPYSVPFLNSFDIYVRRLVFLIRDSSDVVVTGLRELRYGG
jgi:hypothetical protein